MLHSSYVFEVQALGTPLIAIAYEDYGLAVERIEGGIFLVVDLCRHCLWDGCDLGPLEEL